MKRLLRGIFTFALMGSTGSIADEIDFLCYQDSTECEVIAELANKFTEETGHVVKTNIVGYEVIRDQLLNQLQAGEAAPDVARVTDLGGMSPFFLDIAPYVDRTYWEKNFGALLPAMRPEGNNDGIFGWPSTGATGPFVNVTMFEDAGVEIPGPGSTWDDWIAALTEVKETLGLDAAFALDRTGHRFAGPAFAYGAKFMRDGEPILVDEGFRKFAAEFIKWHQDGVMPAEGWPAGSGTSYRNAAPLFMNGQVAYHYGGSWLINSYDSNITDFDWACRAGALRRRRLRCHGGRSFGRSFQFDRSARSGGSLPGLSRPQGQQPRIRGTDPRYTRSCRTAGRGCRLCRRFGARGGGSERLCRQCSESRDNHTAGLRFFQLSQEFRHLRGDPGIHDEGHQWRDDPGRGFGGDGRGYRSQGV